MVEGRHVFNSEDILLREFGEHRAHSSSLDSALSNTHRSIRTNKSSKNNDVSYMNVKK